MPINTTFLKQHIAGNVTFIYFRDNALWYQCDDGFKFPVPASPKEIGTATFRPTDKASLFMRYIRKYMEVLDRGFDLTPKETHLTQFEEMLRHANATFHGKRTEDIAVIEVERVEFTFKDGSLFNISNMEWKP